MKKPTVKYIPGAGTEIKVGERAWVRPLDHPSPLVSNTTWALTSPVISTNDKGFETRNTIYVRDNSLL
jgi:hypothetical protein